MQYIIPMSFCPCEHVINTIMQLNFHMETVIQDLLTLLCIQSSHEHNFYDWIGDNALYVNIYSSPFWRTPHTQNPHSE